MNYPGFTNEEIATVVAYTISSYPEDARRRFRATFQKEAPPRTTLIGWAKRFKATLSLTETARVGDHSDRRLSDDKRQEIVEAFGDDPTLSQRQAAQCCNVSLSSVNRVLKSEGLRAWKFTRVQEISEDDKVKRLQFCNLIRREQERNNHFVDNIVFSDEATFHLNGSVNLHNAFIYAEENPHAVTVKPLKSASITCWAMISPHHGIIYHVQHETMNGERYRAILVEKVVPLLSQRRNRHQIYQQDGAPAHFASSVRALLDDKLTDRWIGRGGPIQWPPRSPDLAVNDFWLWGYIRDKLYRDPRPRTLAALQDRLTSLLDDVEVEMIRASYRSFLRRCELCSENRGGHFEQFL